MTSVTATPNAPTPVGRRERKQQATRRRLLDATKIQMAEGGAESVTIASITERADVGQGTFYNYFQSRDDVIDFVIAEEVETLGQRLDALTKGMPDAAEIFSFSLRHLFNTAVSDPVWGWLMVRLGIAQETLLRTLGPRAARDIQIGVDTGRFSVTDVNLASAMTFGALLSAMRAYLEGQLVDEPSARFARALLCMVGIPADEAHEITLRPLPPMPELSALRKGSPDGLNSKQSA
jgi:AcrR family transcriptional regulator